MLTSKLMSTSSAGSLSLVSSAAFAGPAVAPKGRYLVTPDMDGRAGIAGMDGRATEGKKEPVTDGMASGGRFLATRTSTVALRA